MDAAIVSSDASEAIIACLPDAALAADGFRAAEGYSVAVAVGVSRIAFAQIAGRAPWSRKGKKAMTLSPFKSWEM